MSGAPSQSNNIEAVFPLSPTQEGMLYHTLKNPESAVYVGQHVMELRHAAHEVGFFYLSGHGAPLALADEILALSREFFALPLEEKLAVDMANSPHFRGYTRVGSERTGGRADWREQLDIGLEAAALP